MQEVILVRYGEIVLKGLNRKSFEDKLVRNIKKALRYERYKIWRSQARIYIEPLEGEILNINQMIEKVVKVFGIVSVSPAYKINPDMDSIYEAAEKCAKEFSGSKSFKIECKRGEKSFPLTSPEICCEVGGYILDKFDNLRVDVINPDEKINIEVRENAYVYSKVVPSFGGMPTGTNGKAMVLISGGIDSPVAGWMLGKRGVEIDAVHFCSPPYTGPKAREKVIDLCKIVSSYTGKMNLHIVPFTDIQIELRDKCPQEQLTILMRRYMMRIAEKIAKNNDCSALITGENIGQVASQTMHGLCASDIVVEMPVFRPLIGMDKNDIVDIAKKIGTFETSILPYEDCCTIFLPKRPETKPKIEKLLLSEKKINSAELIEKAIENTEIIEI
ncbi:MAG: tRNA uracil 4-sulfurtransferase ThiI [Deltaproteobacteria bacterium]